MFNLNFGKKQGAQQKKEPTPGNNENTAKDSHRPVFQRQVTIEEEMDSVNSLINDPASFPITVISTSNMIRSSTQTSLSRYNTRTRGLRPGSSRKIRRRAVLKNGDCNVIQKKIAQRRIRFLQDIFTTLVDSQWRWTLIVFALSFILSWLGFAVIWWLIAFTHGDLEDMHLPPNQSDSGWTPCVFNIVSFTSCFLFSIETQHTIGYGVRTTTEECPEAIFMMCFQSIYGVMVQAFMVGIVFAKMTRPKQRTQTLLFSKNAVICQRDGELTLMFRVGDMRKSHIIGASIRAQLIRTKQTKEGEILSQYQTELDIGSDGCASDLFFIWPLIVIHKITPESPLYSMSASDMLQEKFEIVVILEGTVESTGQTTQARSSYLNFEILWGHRFDPVVGYNKDRQSYEIDYSKFNETIQVDTPLCSARELSEFYKIQDDHYRNEDSTSQSPLQQCDADAEATNYFPQNLLSNSSPSQRSISATSPPASAPHHQKRLPLLVLTPSSNNNLNNLQNYEKRSHSQQHIPHSHRNNPQKLLYDESDTDSIQSFHGWSSKV